VEQRNRLSSKRILLGVTGSIAAYKAVDLLRRLQEQGAGVHVVMTKNATRFIAPLTFSTLTRRPVLVDEFGNGDQPAIGHIDVSKGLDLALVAPATANVIGKIASGIADDALTSALMACDCPLVLAPAMNDRMYRNPVLQKNLRVLKEQGVTVVEPEAGWLACGTVGPGRLADAEQIIGTVLSMLAPGDLEGTTVLVTAGPTRETIDAVRFISNPSSGKMGYAIARAALNHGARVILISGPTHLSPPPGVTFVSVSSAAEMREAVMNQAAGSAVVIMAAAVSDFRPAVAYDRKMKKEYAPTTLQLERTEDILKDLAGLQGSRLLVGFAAETDDLLRNAHRKLKEKNLDLIVANDLTRKGAGFGGDTNAVMIIDRSGEAMELPVMPKTDIAERIMGKVSQLIAKQRILP
jgi:phosphopantothenoylcysteine decarboxylase/phosphopantothenate--cysteine ligase